MLLKCIKLIFLSAGFIKLYLNEPIFYIIFNEMSP